MPLMVPMSGAHGGCGAGFQQVTVSTAAVSLLIPAGVRPKRVLLTVQSNDIRFRYDGVDPTPTVGHTATASGLTVEIMGTARILAFRMCRNASSDAEVAYTIEG